MTDEAALLAAVLAAPADDAPRLVYADWLEEQGQEDRAEFIRTGVELARTKAHPNRHTDADQGGRPFINAACDCTREDCRACALRRRERELWRQPSLDDEFFGLPLNQMILDGAPVPADRRSVGVVRRGFVAEVRAPLADLVGGECGACGGGGVRAAYDGGRNFPCSACSHTGRTPGLLPALVRAQPVERVVVTDRGPTETQSGWSYWLHSGLDDTDSLPLDLSLHLLEHLLEHNGVLFPNERLAYPTREAADAALSAALLAWARGGGG